MKTDTNASWARLQALIAWSGLTVRKFAIQLGYPSPEILYRIKYGKNGISRALAGRILAQYPAIRKCWLLCGEGSMLSEEMRQKPTQPGSVCCCPTASQA